MKTLTQKIKSLQYFNGLYSLQKVLLEFLSTVTSLETNSVIVGKLTASSLVVPQGTLFIVGESYVIENLELGDNFSNIGYIAEGEYFIATDTTPLIWTNNTEVIKSNSSIILSYNDVDSNIKLVNINDGTEYHLKITNGKFVEDKIFPYVENHSISYVDTNTLLITSDGVSELTNKYFKIEVYN